MIYDRVEMKSLEHK